MPDTIRDGTGNGYLLAINSDNQMLVRTTSVQQHTKSAADSHYYEATTGKTQLTDAVEKPAIYLLNGHASDAMVIDRVFLDTWTSTGGSGNDGTLEYYRNPVVVGGTDIIPTNCNFGSNEVAAGTFKKMLTSFTATEWWHGYITDKFSLALEEQRFCLQPGNGFGISITAPTGNTNMYFNINVGFYYIDLDLI